MFIVVITDALNFRSAPVNTRIGDVLHGEVVRKILPGTWSTQEEFMEWFTGGGFHRWVGIGGN